MAESFGKDNPYRYKGYYYDEETGMYYLKSRYYDPEICRFISADFVTVMINSPMSLADNNLYAYCDNDPVNKKDEEGELPQFVLMGLIGAAANVGVSFITAKATGQDYGWKNLILDAASGALSAIPVKKEMELFKTAAVAIINYGSNRVSGNSIPKSLLYTFIAVKGPSMDMSKKANLSKDTIGDFAIYTFINTVPYEVISSLSLAVTDTIVTSSMSNSNTTKKSSGTGKTSNVSKTPAPPSGCRNGIMLPPPPDPMAPIVNSWHLTNKRRYA